jgi:hypothetical protein
MSRIIRLVVLLVAVGALATALVAYATAGPPNHANRLEATFHETVKVVTNHVADYGIIQVILTGSGTVEGFGTATEVVGVTADVSVTPCGPRSGSAAATRRIVTAEGTLTLRSSEETCQDSAGLRIDTGTYEVDGAFSTGVFAGATGSGTMTNLLDQGHVVTLSGKLNLANDES